MLSNKLSIIIFMLLLQNASEIRFAPGGSNKIRGEAVLLCEQRGDACPCVCLCTVPLQLFSTLFFFFLSLYFGTSFSFCAWGLSPTGLTDLHADNEDFRMIH